MIDEGVEREGEDGGPEQEMGVRGTAGARTAGAWGRTGSPKCWRGSEGDDAIRSGEEVEEVMDWDWGVRMAGEGDGERGSDGGVPCDDVEEGGWRGEGGRGEAEGQGGQVEAGGGGPAGCRTGGRADDVGGDGAAEGP